MENKKMFTVSIDKEFNALNKEFNNEIYLRVYTSLFQAGIVKELKATNFTTLLAIASFMDEHGNCYPTQRQIADITGMSLPTVNKAVNDLMEFEVNGIPVLKRELVRNGQFSNSYYTINPISQIAIFEGQVKEIETPVKESLTSPVKEIETDVLKKFNLNNSQSNINNKTITKASTNAANTSETNKKESEEVSKNMQKEFKNSKDIAVYFLTKYQEVYGVQANIVWKRDLANIKNKLMNKYSSKQIKTMIDSALENYDRLWKKPAFPRPTIGQLCSWMGEQALAIAEDTDKEYEELAEMTADSEDMNSDVLKKFHV